MSTFAGGPQLQPSRRDACYHPGSTARVVCIHLQATLTAYAGKNRPLDENELELLISELNLQPYVECLNPRPPTLTG